MDFMYMFISITTYKLYDFSALKLNLYIIFLMIGFISSRWLYDFLTVFFKEWGFFKILYSLITAPMNPLMGKLK